MPMFPDNPMQNLAFDSRDVDITVDLGDSTPEQAIAETEEIMQKGRAGECICLRYAPPSGDGKETLFQPLGRYLLQARRDGRLARCLPSADGAGYVIVLAAE